MDISWRYNFGKTWTEKIISDKSTRFTYLNGSSKVSYDNGKSWFLVNPKDNSYTTNTFSKVISNENKNITLDIDSKVDFQILILDKTGYIIDSMPFKSCSGAVKINLNYLNTGIYLVQLKSRAGIKYLGKFII